MEISDIYITHSDVVDERGACAKEADDKIDNVGIIRLVDHQGRILPLFVETVSTTLHESLHLLGVQVGSRNL